MSKIPYPGYPPNFTIVDKTGGYNRICLVVELLTNNGMDSARLAYVQEQLEALLSRVMPAVIEKSQVVTPDRFDPVLKEGLRLS